MTDGPRHRLNELGQPVGFALAGWTPPPAPPAGPMDGRFCRVAPLDPDRHAADLFTANTLDTEGRNWTYLPYGPFASLAACRAWMDRTCRHRDPLFHAIVDRRTGRGRGWRATCGSHRSKARSTSAT